MLFKCINLIIVSSYWAIYWYIIKKVSYTLEKVYIVCIQLNEQGYTNIDALDLSTAMLEVAKKKGFYTNLIRANLGQDKLDIPDSKYTAAWQLFITPCAAEIVYFTFHTFEVEMANANSIFNSRKHNVYTWKSDISQIELFDELNIYDKLFYHFQWHSFRLNHAWNRSDKSY